MKKIPTLFERQGKPYLAYDEVAPGCEWVIQGEGLATVKMDGTCCLIVKGKLYKRRTIKRGIPWPEEFIPSPNDDPMSKKIPGWMPVGDAQEDRWHNEAFGQLVAPVLPGTYELIGPKIQGNPYRRDDHCLIKHSDCIISGEVPCQSFDEISTWLRDQLVEGIVWHHPDTIRKAKIKRSDFGYEWPGK